MPIGHEHTVDSEWAEQPRRRTCSWPSAGLPALLLVAAIIGAGGSLAGTGSATGNAPSSNDGNTHTGAIELRIATR